MSNNETIRKAFESNWDTIGYLQVVRTTNNDQRETLLVTAIDLLSQAQAILRDLREM